MRQKRGGKRDVWNDDDLNHDLKGITTFRFATKEGRIGGRMESRRFETRLLETGLKGGRKQDNLKHHDLNHDFLK
ncbi:hypothetical protein [Aequorivita ciconiae]|uniref:hypothetical protein n=1 Tax=Aequorivita ciconiae TaxID=2494375 RepID=UPI0013E3C79A|nr:hypothetical protein [Aequorivita sp. H23M31]